MTTPRGLTIREIAEQQGLALDTVRFHRGRDPELWKSWEVGERKEAGRRGRPETEYDAASVARHYAEKEQASPQGKPGPKRRGGAFDPQEVVGWKTIAERLGVKADTLRGYPTRYARGNNPFPANVAEGKYRWGDVEAWDDRRGKSGRPGPRTIAGGVPAAPARAHIAQLERAGLSRPQIAERSGVPARTVRRVAAGELEIISPEHHEALLAITVPQA